MGALRLAHHPRRGALGICRCYRGAVGVGLEHRHSRPHAHPLSIQLFLLGWGRGAWMVEDGQGELANAADAAHAPNRPPARSPLARFQPPTCAKEPHCASGVTSRPMRRCRTAASPPSSPISRNVAASEAPAALSAGAAPAPSEALWQARARGAN